MKFSKDLIERAVKTFIQGFLTSASLGISAVVFTDTSVESLKLVAVSILAGGVAAGFSSLMSLLSKELGPDKDSASVVV